MPIVTQYTIQRFTDNWATEYYMSGDQWSDCEDDAEEFYTAAKAQRRADRVGGEVEQYQRFKEF